MLDFTNDQLDFTVNVAPVRDINGNEIPSDMGRGAYRDDTLELIAINGPSWSPIQHNDVLNPILEAVEDAGHEIHARAPDRRALYDMVGKKGAFVDVKLADNGAVMMATVITGDMIQPTGASVYMDKGPDTMLVRHRILNSHNQKFAASVISDYVRVICANGMVKADFSARAYGKHTSGFNIDGLRAKIAIAAAQMENDAELFGLYATTPLSPVQASEFLKATLAKLKDKPDGEANHSQRLHTEILELFQREDATVWGLVQAMTYWATHGPVKANSGEISARLGRDQRVAKALGSKPFAKLISA